ncbi:MAG: phosphoribosylformylglycinamidine synthase [Magnetococcales bacterium]|nr:phosphoribosylformylglycinamidine synthase [Magnetococcales bacterium]
MRKRNFQVLSGGAALSGFQMDKLAETLGGITPSLSLVSARFIHFIDLDGSLSKEDQNILTALLTYGAANNQEPDPTNEPVVVVPRFGSISPWSTKATEIAKRCGLQQIHRLERGIAYEFSSSAISSEDLAAITPHIHDRMTQEVVVGFAAAQKMFADHKARPLTTVPVISDGIAALEAANGRLGLALATDEMEYLINYFNSRGSDPTDVELMMFAQANSEHCRHKIFNAAWQIDGEERSETLFGMIRNTEKSSPEGTLIAYSDNSAVMVGGEGKRFYPDSKTGEYTYHNENTAILMKVETHNHPTAISPYPGAATGSGGEIRDEGATGRGSSPKAGLTGFSVSNLQLPDAVQPWELDYGRPDRIVSPLEIMIEGPLGGAAFNNEFGRPNLGGYFRTYEENIAGEVRGYHKPIMIVGGLGHINADYVEKQAIPVGSLIIQIGGPAMLIGLGGGAASSQTSGTSNADLDFASVQRENPEMERRCQEVINRCWQLGEGNPILSIHDVGAGGLSNAVPEVIHGGGVGGRFELANIPNDDPGMSPMEIWCNEAQERYVLAIGPQDRDLFADICARERCPWAVLGHATKEKQLVLTHEAANTTPIDMDMEILLGKPPRMERNVTRKKDELINLEVAEIDINEAAKRVLALPTVADKGFLITIGDRSVTGQVCRDQMVGPWQVPVADVAVTARDYISYAGEAMAMGERTPVALISGPASGRLAVGEAVTNMAAARINKIADLKLSANWMAPAGHPGEDANLFDTVQAVGMELCPQLGIGIPVGKDSLSLKTVWSENSENRAVTAPVSLVISAFAPVADIRKTLTPQLQHVDSDDTELILIDLANGKNRLGGSCLAQVYKQLGSESADLDNPANLVEFFSAMQELNQQGKILAYHDKSDGGLFATICEMAFVSHCGIEINLDGLPGSPLDILFNEELGGVIQILKTDRDMVLQQLSGAGTVLVIGSPNSEEQIVFNKNGKLVLGDSRLNYHRIWSEVSFRVRSLRDNPVTARQEYDSILAFDNPGMHASLTFDPKLPPKIISKHRPPIAILREQGVNGHVEMAAAFERAGFNAVDVTMSDLFAGRVSLADFRGLAACGGFSYGDVLGAGEGWAKSILFNGNLRSQFSQFFIRPDTFALGVCNGCQMLSNLRELIPGAQNWPYFKSNTSARFEARVVMVEIQESPSILFKGMAGSRLPVPAAHGEGRAECKSANELESINNNGLASMRFVDNLGRSTMDYPANPNGSPDGLTGVTTPDGRVTIMMPHPERAFRTVTNSWYPGKWGEQWGEDGPWLRLFQNARLWIDNS